MADDLYAAAEEARRQSDEFLNRSREQMRVSFASQREAGVGSPTGAAPAAAAGVGGGTAMLAGTPAGRLLDTINQLVRRGVGVAGAAVGAPISTAVGGMQAIGAGVAGGAAFAAGDAPFGPAGMGGGAIQGVQNRMSMWQMLYAGYGGGIPTIGRFAGQRMDMTTTQAIELAKEESKYRLVGGAMKGVQSAWNIASFGLSNFMMRREGMELEYFRKEDYNRSLQQNLRFMTGENLQRAGLGRYRGAFPTGVTREGADVIGGALREDLGRIQSETGASAEQLIAIQGRAMGTMGAIGLNRLMGEGLGAFQSGVRRNTESVRDIQKILNLSEEEADQFFRSMGQMHGTASRIAEMARTSQRAAGRMGMDVRDVFGIVRQFETTGRTQMIGQAATGRVGLQMAEQFRGWQRRGIMMQEEAMMYGGRTYEEGLGIMTQRAFQMGTQMFEQGQLGGMGLMMRYNRPEYQRFAGGRMGAMEMAGVVGGMVVGDPTMQLRARYDEQIRRQTGQEGLRAQYTRVQAMAKEGQFIFGGMDEEMYQAFERNTGTRPLEAKKWFQFFDREKRAIQAQVGGENFKEDRAIHEQGILALHTRLRSEGAIQLAQRLTGKGEYDAVGQIYRESTNMGKDLSGLKDPIQQILRKSFFSREEAITEQRMGGVGIHILAAGMGAFRTNLQITRDQERRYGWQPAVSAADMAALATTFKGQGLTAAQTFREALTEVTAGGGWAAPRSAVDVTRETWARHGWKIPRYADTRRMPGPMGTGREVVSDAVATIVEEGTDISAGVFGVQAFGVTQRLTLQDIIKDFPKLGNILIDTLRRNTEGMDSVSGLRGMLRRRGTPEQIEKKFQEHQNIIAMDKYQDMAAYLFGRGGLKMGFGGFVERLRGAAAGKGGQAYRALTERLPELQQFLAATAGEGGLDVGRLQEFFRGGGRELSEVLEEVTGRTAADIGAMLGGDTNKLFDKDTVNSLFRYVLGHQDMESTPLGGMMSANYMKVAESSIMSLAEEIGKAVAEAIKK